LMPRPVKYFTTRRRSSSFRADQSMLRTMSEFEKRGVHAKYLP
jgi:hypothetical protein